MKPKMLRGPLSSLYSICSIPTFFYSVISLIPDILDSLLILFLYSSATIVLDIYMSYCSDIDLS